MVRDGEVKTVYPNVRYDWITPEDIGSVCGFLLTKAAHDSGRTEVGPIFLYGPELISLRDAVEVLGRALGKTVKVTQLDEQDGLEVMKANGLPEHVAKQLISSMRTRARARSVDEDGEGLYSGPTHEEAVENVRKYTGRRPTSLQEWVEENKLDFSVRRAW
jgi:hypothetical protein